MVVYADAKIGKGIAIVADERFCRSVQHDCKCAVVYVVAYLVHLASVHKGKSPCVVSDCVDAFVGEVVLDEFLQADLTAHCVSVRACVAVYDDNVVFFDCVKRFAYHIVLPISLLNLFSSK